MPFFSLPSISIVYLLVIARVQFFRVSGRVGFDFSGFGSGRVFTRGQKKSRVGFG